MACEKGAVHGFYRLKGCLFRFGRLCIPKESIRKLLVREGHGGSLTRHSEKKTLELVKEHFYWLGIIRDVYHVIERCMVGKKTNSKEVALGLYMSLPILDQPWVDVWILYMGC